MQEQDKEREAFNNVLGLLGDVEEKINVTCVESSEGLVLKLKTEWAALGIPPDGFAHQEMRINFSDQQSSLVYNERSLVVPGFYHACAHLLEDLTLREKNSHRQMFFGTTEHAIGKYLQRGRMKSYFFKVYPMCVKFAPHLPTFEALDKADMPRIRGLLIKEEQKLQDNGRPLRLSGIDFFKNIQWEDKDTRTHAFDPVDTYETGDYHSMQFREDLERYAALSRKQ